jgi:hypothetical protein
MTIRLFRPFSGFPANAVVSLDPGTENALVQINSASFDIGTRAPILPNEPFLDAPPSVPTINLGGPAGFAKNRVLKRMIDVVGVGVANSGTAATVAIDAASPFGRPAYKVDMPAGNTWHEVQLTGLNVANFDGHVIWSVWIADYTAVEQVQVYAGTTGYTRLFQSAYLVNTSNTSRWNGEHKIVVGPTQAGSANTFLRGTDSLAETKIRVFPGAAGASVWVDAVFVPGVGRPTHLITHDDCSVTWMSNGLPVLNEYSLKATFNINTGDINGSPSLFLSSAQVLQIAQAGHQVSCHNVTNTAFNDGTGGTQTASEYTADFISGCATLSSIVGQQLEPGYHAWVQGRNNVTVHDTMRAAGMLIGRGIVAGYNWPQVGLGNSALALRTQLLHTLTPAQITTICNNAVLYGATVVWMVHEITPRGGVGVETAASVYRFLCDRIGKDVADQKAAHLTMQQLQNEVYADRLVPTEFQP